MHLVAEEYGLTPSRFVAQLESWEEWLEILVFRRMRNAKQEQARNAAKLGQH